MGYDIGSCSIVVIINNNKNYLFSYLYIIFSKDEKHLFNLIGPQLELEVQSKQTLSRQIYIKTYLF